MKDSTISQAHELCDMLLRRFNDHRPTMEHAGMAAAAVANGETPPPPPVPLRPADNVNDRAAVVTGFIRGYYGRPGERGMEAAAAAVAVMFAATVAPVTPVATDATATPATPEPAAAPPKAEPPLRRKNKATR